MKCEEFLQLLDADEGWREGEAAAHAAQCPSCAAEARRMETAAAAFSAMREDTSPPFLHTCVMARVREEAAAAPWWKPRRLLRPAWAAPLLVLAIVGVLSWQGLHQEIVPPKAPVPQEEIAEPREVASEQHAPLGDNRIQTPPVALPVLGSASKPQAETRQGAEKFILEAQDKKKSDSPVADEEARANRQRELEFAPAPAGGRGEVKGASGEESGYLSSTQTPAPAVAPATAQPEKKAEKDALEKWAAGTGNEAPSPSVVPETRAKREAPGKGMAPQPLAAAEAPKEYILVDLVDCTLRAENGVEYVALNLPELQAPPPGVQWAVTVKRDGAIEVRDETGNWLKEATEALQAKAPSLNLMPGRYRLGRGR